MRTNTTKLEKEMLNLLKHERNKRNLNLLQPSALLNSIARRHSYEQMMQKDIYHESPVDGSTPHIRISRGGYLAKASAENVCTAPTLIISHNGLMSSPVHYNNIVGSWDEVGIGIMADNDGQLYVTQLFANPVNMVDTHLLLQKLLTGIDEYRTKIKLKPVKTISSKWLQQMASQPCNQINNDDFEKALSEIDGKGLTYSRARIFMFDGYSNPGHEQQIEILNEPKLSGISMALSQDKETGKLKGVFLFLS